MLNDKNDFEREKILKSRKRWDSGVLAATPASAQSVMRSSDMVPSLGQPKPLGDEWRQFLSEAEVKRRGEACFTSKS